MATHVETITADDGTSFSAHLALPESGSGPGVVVLMEIFGANQHIRDVCGRLANAGFVTAAPDLYSRIAPGTEFEHTDAAVGKAMQMSQKLDFPRAVGDSAATVGHLRGLPEVIGKVGVMGFCLGGTLAFGTAIQSDPDACVSYYGSGVADMVGQVHRINCPTMLHFGMNDPFIPREKIDAVRDAVAGRPGFEFHGYAAGHAFNNDSAETFYDAKAAAEAWDRTIAFLGKTLREHLGT